MSAQPKKNAAPEGRGGAAAEYKTTFTELTPVSPATETTSLHVAPNKRVGALESGLQEADSIKTADLCRERHYSVADLAQLWNLSEKTIRRMFENEPGVLQWGGKETRSKRAYTTLRIPETVALRMHRRLRIAG